MKSISIILVLLISQLIFSQEKFDNEKEIRNIGNYKVEEVSKKIDESVTIFGTLLTPKPQFDRIVVIVSGTGKISQKAHNYLTEFLLENNIGVFRFDKRGVGKSSGNYNDQSKVYSNDFLEIYKAFKKLKTITHKKIGFLGHSLGGIITINAIAKDIKPDFLIQWSVPIGKPREILKYQIQNGIKNYDNLIVGDHVIEKLMALNYVYNLIDKHPNKTALELQEIGKKEAPKLNIKPKSFLNFLTPYNINYSRIDYTEKYKNVSFPTLVIFGEKDILISATQSKLQLSEIGNSNIKFKQIRGLNHFMTKKGTSEKTNEIYNIDLYFKKYMLKWIRKQ